MERIAIVGASLAGLSTARALRKQGFEGELTIIGAEMHRPYDRPPLSKQFLTGAMDESQLGLERDGEDLGVHWLLGVSATALEPAAGRLSLSDGSHVLADGFVLATGSSARRLPGVDAALAGVHVLRTLDDARSLRAELVPGARLVVIGAGFIGAEVASTARELGLEVTVVELAATPLQVQIGAEMGTRLAALHGEHGTTLLCGVGVARLIGSDRVTGVELTDGRHLPADVVLAGVGAYPNIDWLSSSGLALGNGVLCDCGGATSDPSVVAVGDCAAWFDPLTGTHQRVEHWTGAQDRAAAAAATLLAGGVHAGGPPKPAYFWSHQYGARIQFAGVIAAGDELTVEAGEPDEKNFTAVYRRAGRPVAVLGVNQVKNFNQWRRELVTEPVDQ
jgi:NADPH-dependent 2,4-dienoyl-CoA reductase/sulfur reductase-like enzyme